MHKRQATDTRKGAGADASGALFVYPTDQDDVMIDPSGFWMLALLAAALFCLAQAVRDFRAKHYGWAVAAAVAGTILLCMPVKTHAVKIDLPAPR
jgi:hypothetical protein